MDSCPTPDGNWLQVYLQNSVRRKLCTKIHCTTCGALEFRRGLLAALARSTGREPVDPTTFTRMSQEDARTLAHALTGVRPVSDDPYRLEEAVRLVLFEIWCTLGEETAERELGSILKGTWAGDVLTRMIEHYAERQAVRRAYEERISPVQVQKRREEKHRLKQEKHAARLAEQAEHNRLWYEQQRNKGT